VLELTSFKRGDAIDTGHPENGQGYLFGIGQLNLSRVIDAGEGLADQLVGGRVGKLNRDLLVLGQTFDG
jgi:hypothetical protein